MRWVVVDANECVSNEWRGITSSVVGQWLEWEISKAKNATQIEAVGGGQIDAVFLAMSGSVDYLQHCRSALRAIGIEPTRAKRSPEDPLIVTGGPVDATPRTAFEIADVLAIGEAFRFVRTALECTTREKVLRAAEESPHVLTAAQAGPALEFDEERPWLTPAPLSPIAEPDPWVDWDVPDVKSDDHVVRITASKGCHLKCGFCATTYRQAYASRDSDSLEARVKAHAGRGERVQALSNDPLNLPGFRKMATNLDHASLTVMELLDDENLAALIRMRPRIVRVGMEGVSARIRRAFGKPITAEAFLERLAILHRAKIPTHAFWVTHAPFESREDWAELASVYERFCEMVDWGMHRAKMTCFFPTPPAPLARYIPLQDDVPTRPEIIDWRASSPHLRRVVVIAGGQSLEWKGKVAEQLGIKRAQLPAGGQTVDLAPTLDDWLRLPTEIIKWPIKPHLRYRVSESYKRRMTTALPTRAAA